MNRAWLLSVVLSAVMVLTAIAQENVTLPGQNPATPSPAASSEAPRPVGPPPTTLHLPPPPVDPNAFRVSSDVELVLLDVSVKDKQGGFVSGLKQEDFQVFENKLG